MRRILGTIGATLAIVAAIGASAAPAGAQSPLGDPAGGPYFGKLDPSARYYVQIDNTGDGVEDVAYRWDTALVLDNVGPKTMPSFDQAGASGVTSVSGGKSFIGPADDAFFVDLGSVFDGVSIDRPARPST